MSYLESLLASSAEFDAKLRECVLPVADNLQKTNRAIIAGAYVGIARAHASGIRTLLSQQNPAAALALLRPQYEAVLRGWWLHYCATEENVAALFEAAVDSSLKDPEFPKIFKMLEALKASAE